MLNLIIRNGTVINGKGEKNYKADIGIKEDKIQEIGDLTNHEAVKTFDAEGLYVCPGIIDLHTHSDYTLLLDKRGESFIRQGVTTEVIGNCGLSAAPLYRNAELSRNVFCYKDGHECNWKSFGSYLEELGQDLCINVAPMVGHAAIRSSIMGYDNRIATEEEIRDMASLLDRCLQEGALGFTTGLEYFPGIAASENEITYLCEVAKKHDALYATHVKNRDEYFQMGYNEAFNIALNTDVKTQISHATPKYGAPYYAADWFLNELNLLRKNNDIGCDVIPYIWGPTTMTALIPKELLIYSQKELSFLLKNNAFRNKIIEQEKPFWLLVRDKCWNDIFLYNSANHPELIGKTASFIGEILGKDPFDALLDILADDGENMFSTLMMGKIKKEMDLINIMKHSFCGVISDAMSLAIDGPLSEIKWSPGCFGWVSKYLRDYVIEHKILNFEESIRKITSYPAQRLGLKYRGIIEKGYYADIICFDLNELIEEAASLGYQRGMKLVLINGEVALESEKATNIAAGLILE